MAGARRAGTMFLLALFAIALVLVHAPLDLGTVRLAGVALLWWYALLGAPLAAVLVTAAILLGRRT